MKTAQLYRMKTKEHICPFGTKAKYLLEQKGFAVEDHLLETKEAADRFRAKHQVKTTPQTFIDGRRIGGYDDLRVHFGLALPNKGLTYKPVAALFGMAFVMALAAAWGQGASLPPGRVFHYFAAFSMCILAVQKLRDLFSFTNGFLNYDLLSLRWLPYAYIYPFAEAFAGVGMLGGIAPRVAASVAFLIGLEGALSVVKAVYVDRRELRCACMGGDSNVPLGFISLSENLLMIAMGVWGWLL
jgi:glutaredoxin